MPKINVLDKHVAELIAAGEVIERPASIVKELMENAIDAGATAITVEIKSGGIRYLRITDNGCGIPYEDVPTAFLRHATSKVRDEADLERIGTLGFRGEALASVCAVARVEMLTKTADAQLGARIELAGGEQLTYEEAGCPDGTTIVVRDLFYNVPARLKFLKRDAYEASIVADIVDKIALSNPHIAVKFIKENRTELQTPGDGKLQSAVYAVFGREFTQSLIPADYKYQGVHVRGLVSIPEQSRQNRKSQHFFVNSRYVRSRTCGGALEEAYRGVIMTGRFPACVLYLDVPNDTVDVNVHPAKTEIRFIQEKTVYEAVLFGVKTAISEYNKERLYQKLATEQTVKSEYTPPETPRLDYATRAGEFTYTGEQTTIRREPAAPRRLKYGDYEIQLEGGAGLQVSDREDIGYRAPVREKANPDAGGDAPSKAELGASATGEAKLTADETLPAEPPLTQADLKYLDLQKILGEPASEQAPERIQAAEPLPVSDEVPTSAAEEPAAVKQAEPEALADTQEKDCPPIRLCGELFKTYILAEVDGTFLIIDKHAAHERILYEKLKAAQGEIDGQLLLVPLTLTFPREEYAVLLDSREEIRRYGFDIDDFGKCTIQVREIPIFLDTDDAAQVLGELAGNLRKNKRDISPELIDDMLHSIACKAAIKANYDTGDQELLAIAQEVYTNDAIRYCPHGRPVVLTMTKYELEKKFHRVV